MEVELDDEVFDAAVLLELLLLELDVSETAVDDDDELLTELELEFDESELAELADDRLVLELLELLDSELDVCGSSPSLVKFIWTCSGSLMSDAKVRS